MRHPPHRFRRWLYLLAFLATAQAGAAPQPQYCRVTMIPDTAIPPFAYKAVLRLDPNCPPNGVAYVRKSSTINTIKKGAPYQPMFPGGKAEFGGKWSWKITAKGSEVPARQLWTLNLWRWEYLTKDGWKGAAIR